MLVCGRICRLAYNNIQTRMVFKRFYITFIKKKVNNKHKRPATTIASQDGIYLFDEGSYLPRKYIGRVIFTLEVYMKDHI